MITIIKGSYPWSLTGMSEESTMLMVGVWAEFFKDYEAELISKALKEVIRDNTTGHAPSIGAIIQKAEEIKKRPVPFKGYITMGTPEHEAFLAEQEKKKNGSQ